MTPKGFTTTWIACALALFGVLGSVHAATDDSATSDRFIIRHTAKGSSKVALGKDTDAYLTTMLATKGAKLTADATTDLGLGSGGYRVMRTSKHMHAKATLAMLEAAGMYAEVDQVITLSLSLQLVGSSLGAAAKAVASEKAAAAQAAGRAIAAAAKAAAEAKAAAKAAAKATASPPPPKSPPPFPRPPSPSPPSPSPSSPSPPSPSPPSLSPSPSPPSPSPSSPPPPPPPSEVVSSPSPPSPSPPSPSPPSPSPPSPTPPSLSPPPLSPSSTPLVANTPNDQYMSQLWGMKKINAPLAWGNARVKSILSPDTPPSANSPVIVCDIDTGVDYNHPDLTTNTLKGYNAITGVYDGMDDHGHGSHTSGTIGGAGNNSIGVAGVAWDVTILPCKFMNINGSGMTSDAMKCISYCKQMGAKVMSNSWGGSGSSQALSDAISTSDALFVVAAGNDGKDIDAYPTYPASYPLANILSVSASATSDTRSSYSNYGRTSTDLFAPGDSIISTYLNSGYASMSGTSMATPHVAGAAGLLLQAAKAAGKSLTTADLKNLLLSTVDQLPAFSGLCTSGGRLNLANAVAALGV